MSRHREARAQQVPIEKGRDELVAISMPSLRSKPVHKNLGDAWRVPHLPFWNPTSSVSFSSLLPSSWLPLIYSPFPLFMDYATVFSCN
jgi:hypothetical protein